MFLKGEFRLLLLSVFISLALNGNLLALSLIYCIALGEPFEFYMRISADLETYVSVAFSKKKK